jgi:hypothetical protein
VQRRIIDHRYKLGRHRYMIRCIFIDGRRQLAGKVYMAIQCWTSTMMCAVERNQFFRNRSDTTVQRAPGARAGPPNLMDRWRELNRRTSSP